MHSKRVYTGARVMIRYRDGVNMLEMLAACGFTSYELRRQHIFGQRTIQKLRDGGLPSWRELDVICDICAVQPGEIVRFVRDN